MQISYIVFGTSGSYDDRSTWPVAIYLDKPMADEHARVANEEGAVLAQELLKQGEYWASRSTWFDHSFNICGGDPTYYYVNEAPFMGDAPMRDMTLWHALKTPLPREFRRTEDEPVSEEEQAERRAKFLASLPRVKNSKK